MIKILRVVLVAFYLIAGSYHFINPNFYYPLIPDYLPYHDIINSVSGLLEIVLAVGVIFPKTRLMSTYGIILMLIAFIPSHIYFIQQQSCVDNSLCVPEWLAWVRLLIVHPLFIFWAWLIRND
ncbi:MAG: hypothetical protein ED556_09230 [Winogradskyella sp.]|uniref:DoxX family protein n=1 Tax=Winogradskyella sp. TaxID=1883156 RepID=UPI000F3CD2AF|nr:hypothetical protein [Winogradskyella sp.]RNC86458.1 MAG: hypothetical protein ED556_09230 [Winogradskyella sp.]